MKKLNTISTVNLKALVDSLSKELKTREAIDCGTHSVSETITLNLAGSLTKNPDETYIPTTEICYKTAIAAMAHYAGFNGDRAIDLIGKALLFAQETNKSSSEYIKAHKDFSSAEEKVQSMLDKMPKKQRTGKTFVKVSVTIPKKED